MDTDVTIREIIERGWVDCANCNAERAVANDGEIQPCSNCGQSFKAYVYAETL